MTEASSTEKDAGSVMHSVTPHLVCAGAAEAIEFYKRAFDAEVKFIMPDNNGKVLNACLCINGSSIMLMDEMPDYNALGPKALDGSPVTIHLMVEDVDSYFERAVKAGATVEMPVEDMFWGDRYGVLSDPCGHKWSVATHLRDVSMEEMEQAVRNAPCCPE